MRRQPASHPLQADSGQPGYAQVALPAPVHQLYTYAIPPEYRGRLAPGMLVEVSFGRRRLAGYVVELTSRSEVAEVKVIRRLLEPEPVFSPDRLALVRNVAAYYLTPLGLIMKAALPSGLGAAAASRSWSITEAGERALLSSLAETQRAALEVLAQAGPYSEGDLEERLEAAAGGVHGANPPSIANTLASLARKGLVRATPPRGSPRQRTATFFTLARPVVEEIDLDEESGGIDHGVKHGREGGREAERRSVRQLGKRQQAVMELLARHGEMESAALNAAQPGASAIARKLAQRRLVAMETRRVRRVPHEFRDEAPGPASASSSLDHDADQARILTPAQVEALAAIETALNERRGASFLVHGVTGSGKTELYLQAISRALERQRGAIALVPEIVLTPQFVQRFRGRFGELVALQHSGLSPGERLDEWERVRQGDARVVVGVRSAIFAPVHNLGIIIIDEEQENSYKQEEGIFYDAREVAMLRADQEGAVVVRGSATPTLEGYHAARRQSGRYLPLPERVTPHALPAVSIVDMRRQPKRHGVNPYLSWPLMEALSTCIERGEQAILFLNRRGFSTAIICHDCGHTLTCVNCSVALTYHRPQGAACCHYCDFKQTVPDLCPDCRGANLKHRGFGTQQLEAMVRERFPKARLQRLDSDATRHRRALHIVLDQLAKGRLDIVIGTQMVAKGHDYPGITLVGVISADAILSLPDFRAAERTFQILTQVAGRAGRGDAPGRVIVQSYNPEHYAIVCAQRHDYEAFYAREIDARQAHFYPPFSYLALLRVQSRDDTLAMQASTHLAMLLRKRLSPPAGDSLDVLGPAPAVLARLKGRYRWNLLIKASNAAWLRETLGRILLPEVEALSRRAAVSVDLDLNPQNMM